MDPARDPGPGSRPALIRRVVRWLRPPRTLRPTRAGWIFFALTFGVGFAALNTGNNLLYLVLSLMLAFLILSGVLSESALRGVRVTRRLPQEIFAGAPAPVMLAVANRKRRVPAYALVVEDHARTPGGSERGVGRVFVLRVGPRRSDEAIYRLCEPRRGSLHFTRLRVSTRFPFGLFSKSRILEAPEDALIYPALEPAPAADARPAAAPEDASRAERGAADASVAGLRDFVPGDPVRRIQWRASLRRAALVVRESETACRGEVEVRLATGDARPGPAFERRVARAAHQVVEALQAGARVALRTHGTRLAAGSGRAQRSRLLTFLAEVEPAPAARRPPQGSP